MTIMNFITNLSREEYEQFVEKHPKSHFLQSYDWGQFAKLEKHLTPHYVGLKEDGKLIAATLLLQKHLPLHLSYFYAPRGFVIDFNNLEVLKTFVEEIKKYTKAKKAIFIKIDPDLIINRTNYLEEEMKKEYDAVKTVQNLKKLVLNIKDIQRILKQCNQGILLELT